MLADWVWTALQRAASDGHYSVCQHSVQHPEIDLSIIVSSNGRLHTVLLLRVDYQAARGHIEP